MIGEHLKLLNKNLDLQSSKYERFAFIGDFNVGMETEAMKDFCNVYGLISLNNKLTCYKKPANSSCTDLILRIHQRLIFANIICCSRLRL